MTKNVKNSVTGSHHNMFHFQVQNNHGTYQSGTMTPTVVKIPPKGPWGSIKGTNGENNWQFSVRIRKDWRRWYWDFTPHYRGMVRCRSERWENIAAQPSTWPGLRGTGTIHPSFRYHQPRLLPIVFNRYGPHIRLLSRLGLGLAISNGSIIYLY